MNKFFEKHALKISISILFIAYIIMIIDIIIRYEKVLEILRGIK